VRGDGHHEQIGRYARERAQVEGNRERDAGREEKGAPLRADIRGERDNALRALGMFDRENPNPVKTVENPETGGRKRVPFEPPERAATWPGNLDAPPRAGQSDARAVNTGRDELIRHVPS
jgi:hypothetical protein